MEISLYEDGIVWITRKTVDNSQQPSTLIIQVFSTKRYMYGSLVFPH